MDKGHAYFGLYRCTYDLSVYSVCGADSDYHRRLPHGSSEDSGERPDYTLGLGRSDDLDSPDHLCGGHYVSGGLVHRQQYHHGDDGHAVSADCPAGFLRRFFPAHGICGETDAADDFPLGAAESGHDRKLQRAPDGDALEHGFQVQRYGDRWRQTDPGSDPLH